MSLKERLLEDFKTAMRKRMFQNVIRWVGGTSDRKDSKTTLDDDGTSEVIQGLKKKDSLQTTRKMKEDLINDLKTEIEILLRSCHNN